MDWNPLNWPGDVAGWFGSAVSNTAADIAKAFMLALWAFALLLLKLAFTLIDAFFLNPDLSSSGPLGSVLPYTMWVGASLVLFMFFIQLGRVLITMNGQGLARVLIGVMQFAIVWAAWLAGAGLITAAMTGLTHGFLSLIGVGGFSGVTGSWIRKTSDFTVAVGLGVIGLLLLVPAALSYLLVMILRECALVMLAATAPISAAGLVAEAGRVWFWKTLRWFLATALIAPMCALVLAVGTLLTKGVIHGAGSDPTVVELGMSLVGVVLVAVGAVVPFVLFRLLAFVDPDNPAGQAARNGIVAAGGALAAVGWDKYQKRGGACDGSASESDEDGTSQGEKTAQAQTETRMSDPAGAQTEDLAGTDAASLDETGVGAGAGAGFAGDSNNTNTSSTGSDPGSSESDDDGAADGGTHVPTPNPTPTPAPGGGAAAAVVA
jgi:type IV secretion system protein TrbL